MRENEKRESDEQFDINRPLQAFWEIGFRGTNDAYTVLTKSERTMNFLVVDDNRLLNKFLTTFLKGKGHEGHSIADSSKVVEWLEKNPCDAVILDISMPKIDGLTLISQIRVKFARLPIVMFTGLGYDEDAMQAAHKAGANGYVSKGLGPSEIYSALMRVIGAHDAAGEPVATAS